MAEYDRVSSIAEEPEGSREYGSHERHYQASHNISRSASIAGQNDHLLIDNETENIASHAVPSSRRNAPWAVQNNDGIDVLPGLHESPVSIRYEALPSGTSAEKRYASADIEAVFNQSKGDGNPIPAKLPLIQEIAFIGIIVISQFLSLAGLGQALAPRQFIARSFTDAEVPDQAWFSAAYSLTAGTFILVSGRIGDMLGHKRLVVSGYAFLGVWSAFAGFSAYVHRQIFFEVCRAMQGFGSALIIPNALALLGRAYTKGVKKNLVFALFGAMAPWGFLSGCYFGSLFAEKTWWPWAFWSYGIASLGLSVFALLAIPKTVSQSVEKNPKISGTKFDWAGSLLGVGGLILVNIAWNNGPLFGWGTPSVYTLLIAGIILLVVFFCVESRAECPILPVSAAMNWTVSLTLLLLSLGWGSFSIWIYYDWRFLEELRGLSPLEVTGQLSPALVCGLLAAGVTGFMMTHAPVSFVMSVAMFAFCVGEVLTATMPIHQTYWAQQFVSIIITPFGMDMSFPAASVIISNQMPPEHQGLAASLIVTVVNYSISIALGVAGTVESQVSPFALNASQDDQFHGIRAALYTAVGMSSLGAVLGVLFFVFTMQHYMKQV